MPDERRIALYRETARKLEEQLGPLAMEKLVGSIIEYATWLFDVDKRPELAGFEGKDSVAANAYFRARLLHPIGVLTAAANLDPRPLKKPNKQSYPNVRVKRYK